MAIFSSLAGLPVLQQRQAMATAVTVPTPGSTPPSAGEPSSQYTEITGELLPGDTLNTSFRRANITDPVRLQIIKAFTGLLDFRDLRPHDRYSILLDDKGALVKCTYESGPLRVYTATRGDDGGLRAEKIRIPLLCRTVKISGVIHSSLFAAFSKFTEDPKLIYAFADIFASKIDFNTETRRGDRFSLVFEKYFKDHDFVGYGRILVARYEQAGREPLAGYYYAPENTPGSYFDPDGRELGASFIRSPVPVGRVSSRFSFHRKHPILGVVRPHLGVDLAAPYGTPIMAAADGRVTFIGRNGGFGRQVVLQHGAGYRTYYGHLSRFRKGLKRGDRVRQKEVIGYVGSSGLATGPHLDYRIRHNGVFMNPFALKFKPKSVLKGAELERFRRKQVMLARLLKSLDDPQVVLVKNVTLAPGVAITFL